MSFYSFCEAEDKNLAFTMISFERNAYLGECLCQCLYVIEKISFSSFSDKVTFALEGQTEYK